MNVPQTPQKDGDNPLHFSIESKDVVQKKLAQDVSGTREAENVATRFPDGTFLGLDPNVTDQKRADDYREHLAAIVESSLDAIVGTDLDGAVTSWNKGAEKIFGFSGPEMVGDSISRLTPEDRKSEPLHILSMASPR